MSAWTPVVVNGALADSLVADFGGVNGQLASLPSDARMCLTVHYSASAATQVRLYLATAALAAAQDQVLIYDSALQLNPGPNLTDYFTAQISVPILANTPMQLRITKAASTATIRFATDVAMGPGC